MMDSDDSDEETKIDDLWGFSPAADEDNRSEEQKRADILAKKKSRKIMESM